MAEELNDSLEYTPTWIVAVVCSIIVFISLCVERALHKLGKVNSHLSIHISSGLVDFSTIFLFKGVVLFLLRNYFLFGMS